MSSRRQHPTKMVSKTVSVYFMTPFSNQFKIYNIFCGNAGFEHKYEASGSVGFGSGSDFDQKLLGIFTSIGNFIYLVHTVNVQFLSCSLPLALSDRYY